MGLTVKSPPSPLLAARGAGTGALGYSNGSAKLIADLSKKEVNPAPVRPDMKLDSSVAPFKFPFPLTVALS